MAASAAFAVMTPANGCVASMRWVMRFFAQEGGQAVRAAEPSGVHRAVGKARLAGPARQRGQHVRARGPEAGGQFPRLAGTAEDEDAHQARLVRSSVVEHWADA